MEEFASLDERKLDSFLKKNRMYSKIYFCNRQRNGGGKKSLSTSLYDYLYVNTGFEGSPIGAEIYRSNDAGKSWRKINEKEIPIFSTFGYYFGKIYISPTNPDKLSI
jgi:hypothetical protein